MVRLDGRLRTSQLLVAVKNGWILEIRATFEGEPTHIVIPKGGTAQDGVLAAGDRFMAAIAYTLTGSDLGK